MENFTERKTPAGCTAPGLSMTTAASALWWTSRGARATKPLTTRCRSWSIWTPRGQGRRGQDRRRRGHHAADQPPLLCQGGRRAEHQPCNEREYGVGMFFFPQNEHLRAQAMKLFELVTRKEGLEFLAWREVPVDPDARGPESPRLYARPSGSASSKSPPR